MEDMRSLILIIEKAMTEALPARSLNETFDTVTSYKWTKRSPSQCMAELTVGKNTFVVWFTKSKMAWHMAFRPKKKGLSVISPFVSDDKLSNEYFGVTGSGMAFQVLSSIMRVMVDFLQKYRPHILAFSAKEPSRDKLYQALVTKHQSTIKSLGYTSVIKDRDPKDDARVFYLMQDYL